LLSSNSVDGKLMGGHVKVEVIKDGVQRCNFLKNVIISEKFERNFISAHLLNIFEK
jgi:hypothetical protein